MKESAGCLLDEEHTEGGQSHHMGDSREGGCEQAGRHMQRPKSECVLTASSSLTRR